MSSHKLITSHFFISNVKSSFNFNKHNAKFLIPTSNDKIITLDSNSRIFWEGYFNDICEEKSALDFPENLRGPWSKLPSQLARIALIIHYTKFVTGETTSENVDFYSLNNAAIIIEYFKSHIRKVYSQLMIDAVDGRNNKIVSWVKNNKKNSITIREAQLAKLCKTSDEGREIFQKMQKEGYGKIKSQKGRGRESIQFVFDKQ